MTPAEYWWLTGELQRDPNLNIFEEHELAFGLRADALAQMRRCLAQYADLVPPERLPLLEAAARGERLGGGRTLLDLDIRRYWAAHGLEVDDIPARWLSRWRAENR